MITKIKPRKIQQKRVAVLDAKKPDKQEVNNGGGGGVCAVRTQSKRWHKGMASPNPMGRPLSGNTQLDRLLESVARVEMTEGRKLLDYFILRAFQNDNVLIALMKKLCADLKAVEVSQIGSEMDDTTAVSIRQKLMVKMESVKVSSKEISDNHHLDNLC